MKETYNWKSLFAGLGIIIVGVIFCLISAYTEATWDTVWLSIGCSLIASGLVILMHEFFIERKKVSELDEWKVEKIYSTIVEMIDITPEAVVTIATFGNQAVDMRIPFQITAKGMKNHDKAGSKIHGFILLEKHA